jgi:hypothetical protein
MDIMIPTIILLALSVLFAILGIVFSIMALGAHVSRSGYKNPDKEKLIIIACLSSITCFAAAYVLLWAYSQVMF